MVTGRFDSSLTHWHPMRVSFVHMTKSKMTAPTITLVESDIPGVYLIPTEYLVKDARNRARINNHEVRELVKDIKNLGKVCRPYVDSFVEGIKEFRQQMRTS